MKAREQTPVTAPGRQAAEPSTQRLQAQARSGGQRAARALRSLVDDFPDRAPSPAAIEYASWLRLLRRPTP